MLTLYNSLTRAKEVFRPIAAPRVGLYVCGMTVYDYCHLGHARVMIVFDVVQRWLRASGYELTYVRNITDIDDKIIRRSVENGETIRELTDRFIAAMREDAHALGVQDPDHEPRATDFVPQMLDLIRKLEQRGLAYQAGDGDVNYAVRKFPGYGKLSGKSLDDLRAGERVDVDAAKKDPLDFVLWKQSKQGEPSWASRWGEGRPGWHIECSAMSSRLLGEHFDIHGGGQDLQFPHHENEIAQSEGAAEDVSRPFVNYWMHNGFVRVEEEKMSKSLGNFFTVREVLKNYDAEVVRLFIARAHYRSPINYSDANLDDSRNALARLYTALKGVPVTAAVPDWEEAHGRRFREAMDDDFNTPGAIAVLFDLAGEVNRSRSPQAAAQLRALGSLLGLLGRDSDAFLKATPARAGGLSAGGLNDSEIEALIVERREARARKDFKHGDAIRKELLEQGVVLEDGPAGTTWRRN